MKFSLTNLFLSLTLVCVLLGWLVDRSRFSAQLSEADRKTEAMASGGLWWSMAEHARQFSIELRESPDQLGTYNRRNLVTKIFWLFKFRSDVNTWAEHQHRRKGKFAISLAADLLSELNCQSHAEFAPLFKERFEDQFTEYFDSSTEEYQQMKAFIDASLKSNRQK